MSSDSPSFPSFSDPSPSRRPAKSGPGKMIAMVVGGLFLVAFCGMCLLLPAVQQMKPAALRTQDINRMKQIAIAMHNYEAINNTLPPAYVADKDGKPLYSWRVLLLPYLEQGHLYQQFHLDEPWDSPHNKPLSDTVVSSYHNPNDDSVTGKPLTSYVVVTGPGTLFEHGRLTDIAGIRDGASNTILFVETYNSGIAWAEPRDLDIKTMPMKIGAAGGISGNHGDGANVAVADGIVRFLPMDVSPKVLRGMFTVNGGEKARKPK